MISSTSRFSRCVIASVLALAAFSLRAANIPENLTVQGWVRADANDTSFATLGSGNYAVDLDYFNDARPGGSFDTFVFTLNRASASWLWQSGAVGGTLYPAMQLDLNHQLLLFPASSTTSTVTLIPGASNGAIKLGSSATLTGSGSTLSTNGPLSVAGDLSNTTGSIKGGASGLTLEAGTPGQNITLSVSGSGDLVFNTNSLERARIKSTGNVGIGTSSPAAALDVAGTVAMGTASGFNLLFRSNADGRPWGIRDDAGVNRLRFARGNSDQAFWDVLKTPGSDAIGGQIWYAGGSERIRLDSAGNLGIGTGSPSLLHGYVEKLLDIEGAGSAGMSIRATNPGGREYLWYADTGGRFHLFDATGDTWRLSVDSSGNVGVGTVNPTTKLQVTGDNAELSLGRSTGDTAAYTRLGMTTAYDTYWASNATYSGSVWNYVNTSGWGGGKASRIDQNDGAITLDTISGGTNPITWNTRLKIANGGNIGIGTTSPTQTLDVAGSIRAGGRTRVELDRTVSGAVGDTVAVGAFANDGIGKNIRIYLKGHNGNVIDVHTYEINEVTYVGAATNWLEVPLNQNAVSALGAAAYAVDIYRQNIAWMGDALYVRVRVKRAIGAGNVQLVVDYDDDSTFTPLSNAGSVATTFNASTSPAGGAIDGYYGAAEWMFPVSNGLGWANANSQGLFIKNSGNVGIGTINPTHKLSVKGTIRANEVIVDTGWADYVFEDEYRLAPLSEVEAHIQEKKHLPGVPSAAEVAKNGISMGQMQATLLAKIEELTLHQIAQEKRLNEQAERIHLLEQENVRLQSR